MNNLNWWEVIAEPPYDTMGAEFAVIFGEWVRANVVNVEGAGRRDLWALVFDLFQKRLDLAVKFQTYFAQQMQKDGHEVWRERFRGEGFDPCYSFAIDTLPRTARFHKWTKRAASMMPPTSFRQWDTDFAPHPELPMGPHRPHNSMLVWEFVYRPQFAAKKGGALKMRRIAYAEGVYLFEHVRNNWVPLMRDEAEAWYTKAVKEKNPRALAAFEWVWFWTNPFGRAAALTGDAISLIVQKNCGFCMRDKYYHQDMEALLLPFDEYVAKRANDMISGFIPLFDM